MHPFDSRTGLLSVVDLPNTAYYETVFVVNPISLLRNTRINMHQIPFSCLDHIQVGISGMNPDGRLFRYKQGKGYAKRTQYVNEERVNILQLVWASFPSHTTQMKKIMIPFRAQTFCISYWRNPSRFTLYGNVTVYTLHLNSQPSPVHRIHISTSANASSVWLYLALPGYIS